MPIDSSNFSSLSNPPLGDGGKLQTEINKTFSELADVTSSFQQEQINIVPFEGGWTAGQLVEHIILSVSGFLEIINGPVTETKREPDALKDKIETDFLDFTTKMKSPEFVAPVNKHYEKIELLKILEELKRKLNRAIETMDLTKTCRAFELHVYGFLTRTEAIYFVLYHTQRHIHQLKNICQHLDETNMMVLENKTH